MGANPVSVFLHRVVYKSINDTQKKRVRVNGCRPTFRIADITEPSLADIPESCKACIYWEFPEDFDKAKQQKTESERRLEFVRKKHEWFVNTMREFGTCGKITYYKDRPVAYAQFAPSDCLPNTVHYPSHPVGKSEEGVIFLSCLYVAEKTLRGKGLGKTLLTNIVEDLGRLLRPLPEEETRTIPLVRSNSTPKTGSPLGTRPTPNFR
jgi:hypothetical protein